MGFVRPNVVLRHCNKHTVRPLLRSTSDRMTEKDEEGETMTLSRPSPVGLYKVYDSDL